MANMDAWIPICGEPMKVWTGTMFGPCFATLVFSYIGHFVPISVTGFYLGRFPKSTSVCEPFDFPKTLSYILQAVLTLLIADPLLKLIVVIFVDGKEDSFAEDFKLMLMFTTWALNLTYYRRLLISNYVKLPGIVPIAASCAFLFFAQIPVLLSTAEVPDYLDLGFLLAYQLLMLLAIFAYVALFFDIKKKLNNIWLYRRDDENITTVPTRALVHGEPSTKDDSMGYGGIDNPAVDAAEIPS